MAEKRLAPEDEELKRLPNQCVTRTLRTLCSQTFNKLPVRRPVTSREQDFPYPPRNTATRSWTATAYSWTDAIIARPAGQRISPPMAPPPRLPGMVVRRRLMSADAPGIRPDAASFPIEPHLIALSAGSLVADDAGH